MTYRRLAVPVGCAAAGAVVASAYKTVLRKAGFGKLYSVREKDPESKPYVLNVAEK